MSVRLGSLYVSETNDAGKAKQTVYNTDVAKNHPRRNHPMLAFKEVSNPTHLAARKKCEI